MEAYHPVPQPEEVTKREREDGMGAYLMMFAGIAAGLPLPILNLLASIIYWAVNKGKSRFVKFHCLQSLWSQLPTTLLNAGLFYWTVRILILDRLDFNDQYFGYLAMVIITNVVYFIFSIVGAIQARAGKMYYFVFFGRLSYQQAFAVSADDHAAGAAPVNRPPK